MDANLTALAALEFDLLSKFVTTTAASTGSKYTLDGEPIAASDLGDPHCMLPLVVAAMHSVNRQMHGTGNSLLTLLEPADPQSHWLGLRIKALPEAPSGALLLLADYAVRQHLNCAPQPDLTFTNPIASTQPSPTCELAPHLVNLGLRNAPSRPAHTPGNLDR